MNPKNILSKAILAAAGLTLSVSSAMAQINTTYAPGDVVLYFEQYLGSNTVMLNVGAGTMFRDTTTNILNIANIGSLLSDNTNGFGAGWANDTNLWMGAAGVRSAVTTTASQIAGDPNRTIYVSQARAAAGTEGVAGSPGYSGVLNASMTTGSSQIGNMANRMDNFSLVTTLVEGTGTSTIDNQNPFTILGVPNTAFQVFPGGVMKNFGASTFGTLGGVLAENALDLYRILATTAPSGTVIEAGDGVGQGSYQGSFVIDNGGNVSFIVAPVPEPTTMGATLVLGLVAGAMRRRRRVTA